MQEAANTFYVEAVFHLTARGLVLIGELSGTVEAGNYLLFEKGFCWIIKSVEAVNKRGQPGKIGLIMAPIDADTQKVLTSRIIGTSVPLISQLSLC